MSAYLGGKFGPVILTDAKTSPNAQIKEEQLCWGCAGYISAECARCALANDTRGVQL